MSVTGFASSPAEFDDETRHIVAPPACSEHHLHHHHHHQKALLHGADHGIPQIGGVEATTGVGSARDDKEEEGEIVITAAQKMLAACSGSLLTSLLGKPIEFYLFDCAWIYISPYSDAPRCRASSTTVPTHTTVKHINCTHHSNKYT